MNAWIDAHSALLLCVLGSVLVTQLPKVLPVTFLRGDCLPALLRAHTAGAYLRRAMEEEP